MTSRALLVSPVRAVAAAAALLALAALLASCGEGEEEAGPGFTPATPSSNTGVSPGAPPATNVPSGEATPSIVPTGGWRTFNDASVSLTLAYPPDLTPKDISGGVDRGTQFSDPNDPIRGFTVGILDNSAKLTIDEWFREFNACVPGEEIREIVVAGQRALSCTANVLGDVLEETVAFAAGKGGVIVYVSSTLDPGTFNAVLSSFEVGQ